MRTLFLLILLLLASAVTATPYPPHGVVLMYHRFDENRYPSTNIRMEQFEAQLDYLQREGFHIWPLRKLLTALDEGTAIPDKTVVLTVDDAYLSVYEKAFPLIQARDLPLTVFVSTVAVDEKHNGYMSWEQMREMQRHGVDFANHSHGHLHLNHRLEGESEAAWLERVSGDIEKAQQRLEKELGVEGKKMLAYPFGEYNLTLASKLREMGYTAFGQHSGAIGRDSDRSALARFPINEHFGAIDKFAVKVASLPLPIEVNRPEPEIGEANPPRLTLELKASAPITASQVNCFLGNGSPLQITREGKQRLSVVADQPLDAGRSRYNCTAPAGNGRFYWFSQPWFNGPDPADPAY